MRARAATDRYSFGIHCQFCVDRQQSTHGLSHLASNASTIWQPTGQLVRIEEEIDPHLEAAEIQRRVYQARGRPCFFARVKGCRFPMVSQPVRHARADALPLPRHARRRAAAGRAEDRSGRAFCEQPLALLAALPRTLWHLRPKRVAQRARSCAHETTIDQLPQLVVLAARRRRVRHAAAGLHRGRRPARLAALEPGHVPRAAFRRRSTRRTARSACTTRFIAASACTTRRRSARGVPLRVNIFVGGPPALTLAAVMPLPEGLPELAFAGALGGRRVPLIDRPRRAADLPPTPTSASPARRSRDKQLPEGPVRRSPGLLQPGARLSRCCTSSTSTTAAGAIWPFTVVGRPPQEDTSFGAAHPRADRAGHPDRHPRRARACTPSMRPACIRCCWPSAASATCPTPTRRQPQELLTQANAILGQGQLSLAKYLLIVAERGRPGARHPRHRRRSSGTCCERVDWTRDLHFQTRTTIDTLDYSGSGLNEGSKVVIAAAGPPRRELPTELPADLRLPDGFRRPARLPAGRAGGARAAVRRRRRRADAALLRIVRAERRDQSLSADRARRRQRVHRPHAEQLPVGDVHAHQSGGRHRTASARSREQKHWGCRGPLVIDARIKPHHAPPLVEDPAVTRRVDALAARGGPLHGMI